MYTLLSDQQKVSNSFNASFISTNQFYDLINQKVLDIEEDLNIKILQLNKSSEINESHLQFKIISSYRMLESIDNLLLDFENSAKEEFLIAANEKIIKLEKILDGIEKYINSTRSQRLIKKYTQGASTFSKSSWFVLIIYAGIIYSIEPG